MPPRLATLAADAGRSASGEGVGDTQIANYPLSTRLGPFWAELRMAALGHSPWCPPS
jgi:hypothetical protein